MAPARPLQTAKIQVERLTDAAEGHACSPQLQSLEQADHPQQALEAHLLVAANQDLPLILQGPWCDTSGGGEPSNGPDAGGLAQNPSEGEAELRPTTLEPLHVEGEVLAKRSDQTPEHGLGQVYGHARQRDEFVHRNAPERKHVAPPRS